MSKFFRLIGIIIFIAVICIVGIGMYLLQKLNEMDYQPIDKSELSINDELYSSVSKSVDALSKTEFNGIESIVLYGSDARNTGEASRSDTIMILSINPKMKSIKLISIPRDTYVSISGHGKTKINHAYAYGKETLSLKTINENFGLNLDKYATVDFLGLINVINDVGGITVDIDKDEMNYINQGLSELKMYSDKLNLTKVSNSGTVTLTGEQALVHSRNRTTGAGNDFERANRQRVIMESLIKEFSDLSYDKMMSVSDTLFKNIKTNVTSEEYLKILGELFINKSEYSKNILTVQIPSIDYSTNKYIKGIYYFVPDINKSKQDFIEYLYNK